MKTILIADEDNKIRNMVRLIFTEHMGYRVVAVVNGTDAILKAKEIKPDIVLVDISISNQNGYKVSREIKSDPLLKNTSVILLASAFETFNKDKAFSACADDIIIKPFEPEGLVKKVEYLTRENEQRIRLFIKVHKERRKRMETKFVELMISLPVFLMITVPILSKTIDFNRGRTESNSLFSYERVIEGSISDIIEENEEKKASRITESHSGLEQPYVKEFPTKGETKVPKVKRGYSKELKTAEVREHIHRPKEALNEIPEGIKYVIKRGDTLWNISNRFNTSVRWLKVANDLNGNMIYAGDVLIIPTAKDTPTETPKQDLNGNKYTIRKGDTLWNISSRFHTSVKDLKHANKLNKDTIYVGDTLVIPAVGEEASKERAEATNKVNL